MIGDSLLKYLSVIALFGSLVSAHAEEPPTQITEEMGGMQQALELLLPDPLVAKTDPPRADVKIRITGSQWAWSYQYITDSGSLLDVPELVVPVDQFVELHVTSSDVIHEFTIPAFGIKVDGVPGSIASAWFKPLRVGTYFGQCSALCGEGFADMVISVEVVSADDYASWLDEKVQ